MIRTARITSLLLLNACHLRGRLLASSFDCDCFILFIAQELLYFGFDQLKYNVGELAFFYF